MNARTWNVSNWEAPGITVSPNGFIQRGLDPECLELCKAINECLDGVMTVESCCGHGESPYHIWCAVKSLRALARLAYWIDGCHSGVYDWRVIAIADCGEHLSILIEGPPGAFADSEKIAAVIRDEA